MPESSFRAEGLKNMSYSENPTLIKSSSDLYLTLKRASDQDKVRKRGKPATLAGSVGEISVGNLPVKV